MKKRKKIIVLIILLILIIIAITLMLINRKKDYTIKGITNTNIECFSKDKICEKGTLVSINVNKDEKYDFYVIDDTGSKLTLIMNKNIGNNTNWSLNSNNCTKGPDNLIDYIKKLTANWSNIEEKEYTISDDNNCYAEKKEKLRARIPTLAEVTNNGCEYFYENTCPNYLTNSLGNNSSGYWLSTTKYPDDQQGAYTVYKNGSLSSTWVITDKYYGLRIVIEVEK